MKKFLNRRSSFWLTLLGLLLLIFTWRQFTPSPKKDLHPPQAVVVASAHAATIPIYLAALGSVTSSHVVTVRTQISGQLQKVFFEEGQMVKKGQVLAEIDASPYEAQLLEHLGQLDRDQALLENAKVDLERYQKLWRQDSVAKQTLDTQIATVKQYEGLVKIDQGVLQNTKINLSYCKIVSPIDGRVGLRLVDPGNYIQVSDSAGLAVITRLQPIEVVFPIPEDNVPDILSKLNANTALPVDVYDRTQKKLLARGHLLTMDNQIDATTGTVKLKAQFPNKNLRLFPNQFVNVQLLMTTLKNVIVVPTAAIQRGTEGTFVYRVNAEENQVNVLPVTTGVTYQTVTIIQKGLNAGDRVVIEGADKLTDAALIKISTAAQSGQV